MLTWVLAGIVLLVAVVLTVTHIREQARFSAEREYNDELRKKKRKGELTSEAAFDEQGNRVAPEELETNEDQSFG